MQTIRLTRTEHFASMTDTQKLRWIADDPFFSVRIIESIRLFHGPSLEDPAWQIGAEVMIWEDAQGSHRSLRAETQ